MLVRDGQIQFSQRFPAHITNVIVHEPKPPRIDEPSGPGGPEGQGLSKLLCPLIPNAIVAKVQVLQVFVRACRAGASVVTP